MLLHADYAVTLYRKNQSMDDRVISVVPSLIQNRILISVFNKLIQYLLCNVWGLSCFFKCSAVVVLVPL